MPSWGGLGHRGHWSSVTGSQCSTLQTPGGRKAARFARPPHPRSCTPAAWVLGAKKKQRQGDRHPAPITRVPTLLLRAVTGGVSPARACAPGIRPTSSLFQASVCRGAGGLFSGDGPQKQGQWCPPALVLSSSNESPSPRFLPPSPLSEERRSRQQGLRWAATPRW